jgi:hypothetical protein
VIRHPGGGHKSYLTFVRPQWHLARQYISNSMRNFRAILGKRLYQDSGMKELIEQFHNSAAGKAPPPIPYREIVLTSRLLDRIFDHYPARQSRENAEKANVAAHA